MKPSFLTLGDTIGIVAPSRPVHSLRDNIQKSAQIFKDLGYRVKFGKNFEKQRYYSAGTPEERAEDIHSMFIDKEVKAIVCATGGSSANQLLPLLDLDLIRKHPKIFLGYSDITVLLLSFYAKTGLMTFHGPDFSDFCTVDSNAREFLIDLLSGRKEAYLYPSTMTVIKPGSATGKLLGGNITLINSLLGSMYSPEYGRAVLFWEEVGESPAMLDFKLNELKLSGSFENLSAMIVGNLSECIDKKHPEDNRPIEDIILETTKEYDFPIVQVDYFGHDVSSFYTFPIGAEISLDTEKRELKLIGRV